MVDQFALLEYDPTAPLLASGDQAVAYFTRRDLLGMSVGPIQQIWGLPAVLRILRGQGPDGSWKGSPNKKYADSGVKYPLLETWRQVRYLVDQYEIDRRHPAVEKAAEYLLSCQTEEGDIRGILANQYAPYYTAAILALLIKAGYGDDPRIEKGMRWLLAMRQDDGGWVIGSPGMVGIPWSEVVALTSDRGRETMHKFDRSKPFSAAGTGMAH